MIDADGSLMGIYRKSHIPDGPGYQEKYYFRPGDTGFRVWDTKKGRIGVGICWDQWYPGMPRAPWRCMGADVLLYPTAIGSEPHDASLDTAARWRRAMLGHAVSNVTPVAAANRVGVRTARCSTARRSSPTTPAKSSAISIASRKASLSPPSTWTKSIAHAPPGVSSATGARISTVRWSVR
jgi:predicted amidohydrolase